MLIAVVVLFFPISPDDKSLAFRLSLVFPGTGADAGGGGGGLDGGHHEDAGRAPEVLGVVPGLAGVPLPRGGAHPRGGETLHRHDGKSNKGLSPCLFLNRKRTHKTKLTHTRGVYVFIAFATH